MNNLFVIVFSGKIGSGKSSVSDALSKTLNLPKVSFGDYVKKFAKRNKLDVSRSSLQNIGQSMVDSDPYEFCYAVLNQINYSKKAFILDGLRHISIIDILKKILIDHKFFHIHLTVSEFERSERVPAESKHRKQIDSHPSEIEVESTIASISDLDVDTTCKLPEDISKYIFDWLKQINAIKFG